jgi:hypothetical protein
MRYTGNMGLWPEATGSRAQVTTNLELSLNHSNLSYAFESVFLMIGVLVNARFRTPRPQIPNPRSYYWPL